MNSSKLGTLVYLHTLDAHNYYVLFKDNRKLELYLYKMSTSNKIYLFKFRCRSNNMPDFKVYKHADTYDTKCKICDKDEIEIQLSTDLFVQYFRKTTIDCSKSITDNFQACISLLN